MRIITVVTEFLIKIITNEFLFSKSHIIVFFSYLCHISSLQNS